MSVGETSEFAKLFVWGILFRQTEIRREISRVSFGSGCSPLRKRASTRGDDAMIETDKSRGGFSHTCGGAWRGR